MGAAGKASARGAGPSDVGTDRQASARRRSAGVEGRTGTPKALELVSDLCREGLARGSRIRLRVWGESMVPAIWPGDWIEVERLGECRLAPGQIVLAASSFQVVAHRIVALRGMSVITRGDGLESSDPPWDEAALLGRVVRVRRRRWAAWWTKVRRLSVRKRREALFLLRRKGRRVRTTAHMGDRASRLGSASAGRPRAAQAAAGQRTTGQAANCSKALGFPHSV